MRDRFDVRSSRTSAVYATFAAIVESDTVSDCLVEVSEPKPMPVPARDPRKLLPVRRVLRISSNFDPDLILIPVHR